MELEFLNVLVEQVEGREHLLQQISHQQQATSSQKCADVY